jgi:CHAT domain-containing protein
MMLLPATLLAREPDAATWLQRGLAAEAAGQRSQAIAAFERAAATGTPGQILEAKTHLGAVCACDRPAAVAEQHLREALALAAELRDDTTAGQVWLNLGNNLAAQGKTADALAAFTEAAQQPAWAARARANGAAVAAARGDKAAEEWNAGALAELEKSPAPAEAAWIWLRCAETDARLGQTARAAAAFDQARAAAEKTGDRRALCYALGGRAGLPGASRALELTRQAAFLAQELALPEALYRWEWQTGRLLKAAGDRAGAIAAYRRSIAALEPIRAELMLGCGAARPTFREAVAPVYYELADLLLADDAALPAAQAVLEQLQSAELEDYLQDECATLAAPAAKASAVPPGAAVLHIIPLAERTELLLVFPSGLERVRVPVGADELSRVVRQFRQNLERRTTSRYLEQAQQLHRWLIAPVTATLARHGTDTIVLEPQGALRSVPLAALHDGKQFLIEHYAVAVTPGAHWRVRPMPRSGLATLAGGLSAATQNFPDLPGVPAELTAVMKQFPGQVLLDGGFATAAVRERLQREQFQVVHLATHAQVEADFAKSFLLTRDGRLTLDELEGLLRPGQFRGKPVELLTLSACQTAAGDERAVLGLAGVAVKAGARSAVATLWFVHDESTTLVMTEFYRALKTESKAKALQAAQIKALRDPRFEHAGYWAPYLVIGNWL